MHLAWRTLTATGTPRRLAASSTAGRATTRLIHQSFLLVELLLSGGKHKIISALTAF
jgi:hypothetical protein